jgi:hypothetical protein
MWIFSHQWAIHEIQKKIGSCYLVVDIFRLAKSVQLRLLKIRNFYDSQLKRLSKSFVTEAIELGTFGNSDFFSSMGDS